LLTNISGSYEKANISISVLNQSLSKIVESIDIDVDAAKKKADKELAQLPEATFYENESLADYEQVMESTH